MEYNYVFDSNKNVYESKLEIDRDKNDEITVFFENENIVLTADAHGNAVFSNTDGTELFKDKASSDRLFSFIYCTINKGTINVRFPVTETIDHYPDCDGEYDRYSVRIVDNIIITYPVTSKA